MPSPEPSPDTVYKYFQRLALPEGDASKACQAALARAHDLRKFEIENYWKRSSYFWGFQLVAFGALALSTDDGKFTPQIVVIVSVLGAVAALTALLSAKGSRFWQENWEAHVDFLELAVEGRLHNTALVDARVSYSVSRVNERFLEVIFAGWLIAFVSGISVIVFPVLMTLDDQCARLLQFVVPSLALLFGLVRVIAGQKSGLRGRAFFRKTMDQAN